MAVLPVILFHAGFPAFSGGYIGVDIFFVISGYLITSLILTEKQAGTFTLVGFYERRARRILPALFVVMWVCVPFAWWWLIPSDMKEFSQSLVAVSTFASNVLFLLKGGYFDTDVELKPLLHTWSLAVEEQYYLLFPIFLLITWRLGKLWIVSIVVAVAFISLVAAQWGSLREPAATFYLLPTRGWELLIGAFIAFYLFGRETPNETERDNRLSNNTGSLLGLLLITYAVFSFDKSTPYPGFFALIPTIGTAFVILCATPKTFVGKLLSTKPLVGMGLISYSTYLWHQPLLAFARNRSINGPSSALLLIVSASAVCLGYVSWRYVERPFRDKGRINKRTLFVLGSLVISITVGFGLCGHLRNGFEERLSPGQRELASFTNYNFDSLYRRRECFLEPGQSHNDFSPSCKKDIEGGAAIFIWGDSYAAALSSGFRSLFSNVVQYTVGACGPFVGLADPLLPTCKGANDFILLEVKQLKPRMILLHARWSARESQLGRRGLALSLTKTIERIREVSPSSNIFVVGSVPQWPQHLPVIMLRKGIALEKGALVHAPMLNDLRALDDELHSVATNNGISFLSPIEALCIGEKCQAVSEADGKLEPTAWDYGHLTLGGATYLARKFAMQMGLNLKQLL